jgi:solute carrier family 13 (sodium-dependent dicarboxylate transporter), member 2/3/5
LEFRKLTQLLAGPLIFLIILLSSPPPGMPPEAWNTLAVTIWVAIWWITEAVPIPVTSLLPLVLFPLTGVMTMDATGPAYADKIIWLYTGGFILALAIEKWHLHERIALMILSMTGTKPEKVILGFMISCALLSMWISNTATAIMMLPMGLAVIRQLHLPDGHGISKALLISIAYSCSIGGIATIIGTPTNLVLAGIVEKSFNTEISFYQWFILGFPLSVLLLVLCWYYLTRIAFDLKIPDQEIHLPNFSKKLEGLGKMKPEEKRVLTVFSITALLWIFRPLIIDPFIPEVNDSIIALGAAISLFLIPASHHHEKLMDWDTAVKLPWGIVLLFGGGLAIAKAFQVSGLAEWMGNNLLIFETVPIFLIILMTILFVNFLTEFTSNVATAAMILPVLSVIALSMNIHPYTLMAGASIAASCAFMLPVATPPNAIVFAGKQLKVSDMVKAGFIMNIISVVITALAMYYLLPYIWELDIHSFPDAFKSD